MTDQIVMGCSVDASEMPDEQVTLVQQMANVFEEQFALFVEKNRGYGNVFETGGHSEMQRDEPVFDTPFEANLYRLWCRIQDKDNRFYSQAFGESDDIESLSETSGDAANYWMMVTLLSRYRAPVTDEYGPMPWASNERKESTESQSDDAESIQQDVYDYIVSFEPVHLEALKSEFGEDGVDAVYELIDEGIVGETGWKFHTVEPEPIEPWDPWEDSATDESAESDVGCDCKHCSYYKQS